MPVEEVVTTSYKCTLCGHIYTKRDDAESCASRPISQDKGVRVGDTVLVTSGEGRGELARVDRIGVYDKDWGHYQSDKYWHTVFVEVKLIHSWGTRQLSFDHYEVVK